MQVPAGTVTDDPNVAPVGLTIADHVERGQDSSDDLVLVSIRVALDGIKDTGGDHLRNHLDAVVIDHVEHVQDRGNSFVRVASG
jgi:hypothetical protein